MPRPKKDVPTDREMEILHVLWERGACTTRDVVDELNRGRTKEIAYNSVQTILNIMHTKGFVVRDDDQRSHIFEAARTRDDVETQLIRRLARTAFKGSTMRIVTRALSIHAASADEARRIEQLLEILEDDDGDP